MSEATELTSPQTSPRKHAQPISEATKRQMVARYAVCANMSQVAREFGCHLNTVYRLVRDVKRSEKSGLSADWKQDTKIKAALAVNAGLDCRDDPYKRGELGNKVLIGLGEFKSGVDVNVGVQVNQCPPELLARLIETPVIEVESVDPSE